jgi:hypothetical protein
MKCLHHPKTKKLLTIKKYTLDINEEMPKKKEVLQSCKAGEIKTSHYRHA